MINEKRYEKRLAVWEEAVGKIIDIDAIEDDIILDMNIGRVSIPFDKELLKKLQKLKGKKASILRTDIPDKEFLIMEVKNGS